LEELRPRRSDGESPDRAYILQAGSSNKNNQIGLCQHRGDASGPTRPPSDPVGAAQFCAHVGNLIAACARYGGRRRSAIRSAWWRSSWRVTRRSCAGRDPRVTSGTPPAAWWPRWDSSFLELAP